MRTSSRYRGPECGLGWASVCGMKRFLCVGACSRVQPRQRAGAHVCGRGSGGWSVASVACVCLQNTNTMLCLAGAFGRHETSSCIQQYWPCRNCVVNLCVLVCCCACRSFPWRLRVRQSPCWWLVMAWRASSHRWGPTKRLQCQQHTCMPSNCIMLHWSGTAGCRPEAVVLCANQARSMHLLAWHVCLIAHRLPLLPFLPFWLPLPRLPLPLQLETGTVDDELAALKKGMLTAGSKGTPVAALPEGRPVKDAIDMELEELRKKAKE